MIASVNDQQGCILTVPSYLNYRAPSAYNLNKPRRNSFIVHNTSTLIVTENNFNRIQKRSSLPTKIEDSLSLNNLNKSYNAQLKEINPNQLIKPIPLSETSTTACTIHSVLTEHSDSNTNNDSLRTKKSFLFDQTRHNSSQSQLSPPVGPYIVKRKFSMGQIKVIILIHLARFSAFMFCGLVVVFLA